MYREPFVGKYAMEQPKRILILGESHHDIEAQKTTQKVMDEYLAGAYSNTFQKIALAFGIDTGEDRDREKALFWDKAFFGNYIDVSLDGPSGEGENTAPKLIRKNKKVYNIQLAEFIQEHKIDVVFCFSFRAFDALPPAPPSIRDEYVQVKNRRRNIWCGRVYGPDSLFGRRVEIYGIPHPNSWRGFGAEDMKKHLLGGHCADFLYN